eukprot:744832-Amphidinium_carterae.1
MHCAAIVSCAQHTVEESKTPVAEAASTGCVLQKPRTMSLWTQNPAHHPFSFQNCLLDLAKHYDEVERIPDNHW